MKANELMLGDWVQVPSLIDNVEHYDAWCKVKQLRDYDLDVVGFKELKYSEIMPIPITPEILEKIGFETQPNIGYIIDDYDGTQIIYDSWNHNLRIIKNYKTCLDIETFNDLTVHELQHALMLCGIEKEIIL